MKRFKRIYIETTNICNLNCTFCPKTKRNLQIMNVEQFSNVISKVKDYTDYVYFHIMGEPLNNPNLEEFLRICENEKLKVNITTNGTLLIDKLEILKNSKSLRKVSVSLHSFEANNLNTKLINYLSDVITSVKELSRSNIICELRLWNEDNDDAKTKNCKNLNLEIIDFISKEFDCKIELDKLNQAKLSKNVFLKFDKVFDWPNMNSSEVNETGFCYGLRTQLGILVDGTIVPCCLDNEGQIVLGNIFNQSLEEILNSKLAQNIYNGFSNRKCYAELCKHCGYIQKFYKK